MIEWTPITSTEQLSQITQTENQFLIFKHSTTCSISAMAKKRFERDWNASAIGVKPFIVDLLNHRDVSNKIAEVFQVYHESPQILLIQNKVCVYDASHLDISFKELVDNTPVVAAVS